MPNHLEYTSTECPISIIDEDATAFDAKPAADSEASGRRGRLRSLSRPLDRILRHLPSRRKVENGFAALCPAHDDRKPSLSVGTGKDGRILLTCHAGCDLGEICDALGIEKNELFVKAEYSYHDEEGKLLFQVIRTAGGEFWQRQPDNHGGWVKNVVGVRKVLYRFPEVLSAAKSGSRIYIVEGEKDVESVVALGAYATTNPEGAGRWRDEFSACLSGADIVILPDNDKVGREHAEQIAGSLRTAGISCRIVNLPGLAEKEDLSDWLTAGGDLAKLERLVAATPEWTPAASDVSERAKTAPTAPDWPSPLDEAAFQGLAGEIVRTIEPETEADPAALLANLLIMFGNAVGRGPHLRVGADRQHANLFGVLVGATSGGRKGTATRPIRSLMGYADSTWEGERIVSGLSSGEGLIANVRDGQVEASEKRLLVIEEEFASPLQMLERVGNTLSPVVRAAWDSGNLQTLTKNNPLRSRNAHISIMGHITQTELSLKLRKNDMFNGFAPRFLWIASRRSKSLPNGGRLPEATLESLGAKVGVTLQSAVGVAEVKKSKHAAELWREHYERLTTPGNDLVGVLLTRGAPQVLRLALVYALLDGSARIDHRHMEAALAFWKYCEDSVRVIFGKSVRDNPAQRILSALTGRPEGMTRTELFALFSRNKTSEEITAALGSLGNRVRTEEVANGSRVEQRWFAV